VSVLGCTANAGEFRTTMIVSMPISCTLRMDWTPFSIELVSKLLSATIGCKARGSALSAKKVLDVPQHASEPFPPPALPTNFSLDFAAKPALKPVLGFHGLHHAKREGARSSRETTAAEWMARRVQPRKCAGDLSFPVNIGRTIRRGRAAGTMAIVDSVFQGLLNFGLRIRVCWSGGEMGVEPAGVVFSRSV
jgi:hypothetical protein